MNNKAAFEPIQGDFFDFSSRTSGKIGTTSRLDSAHSEYFARREG